MFKLYKKLSSAAIILSVSTVASASNPEEYAQKLMPWVQKLSETQFATGYVRSPTPSGVLLKRANTGDGEAQEEIMQRVLHLDAKVSDELIKWQVWPSIESAEENDLYAHFLIKAKGRHMEYIGAEVLRQLHRRADEHNAEALLNRGVVLMNEAYGHDNTFYAALQAYHHAASLGCAEASYDLGKMYKDGVLVEKRFELSFIYLAQAAIAGHAKAQFNLAYMLEHQQEYRMLGTQPLFLKRNVLQVIVDIDKLRLKLLLSAANHGLIQAYEELGILYFDKHKEFSSNSRPRYDSWWPSKEVLLGKSLEYLTMAAEESKNPRVAYRIGEAFRNGYPDRYFTNADYISAALWYRKAAQLQHIDATFQLGSILLEGRPGVNADVQQGLRLLKSAATQKHLEAAKRLHLHYWPDHGLPINKIESLRYLINNPDIACFGAQKLASVFRYGYKGLEALLCGLNIGKHSRIKPQEFTVYQPSSKSAIASLFSHMDKLDGLQGELVREFPVSKIFMPVCDSLKNYCNELSSLWRHLQNAPVLLTNFSLAAPEQYDLSTQEEPHFIHNYVQDGVSYLTVGEDNVRAVRHIGDLLSDSGGSKLEDSFDIISHDISTHVLVCAAEKVGAQYLVNRLQHLAADYGLELDETGIEPIETFGQAKATLASIRAIHLRAMPLIDIKRLDSIVSLRETGMVASDLEFSESSLCSGERYLAESMTWFTKLEKLLTAARAELREMVVNTRLRNESAENDELLASIKKTCHWK